MTGAQPPGTGSWNSEEDIISTIFSVMINIINKLMNLYQLICEKLFDSDESREGCEGCKEVSQRGIEGRKEDHRSEKEKGLCSFDETRAVVKALLRAVFAKDTHDEKGRHTEKDGPKHEDCGKGSVGRGVEVEPQQDGKFDEAIGSNVERCAFIRFDRDDGVITLCEIKYSDKPFAIDKTYAKVLDQKIEVFESRFPTKAKLTTKQIDLAMISTFGVKHNMYYEDLVQNEVFLLCTGQFLGF